MLALRRDGAKLSAKDLGTAKAVSVTHKCYAEGDKNGGKGKDTILKESKIVHT